MTASTEHRPLEEQIAQWRGHLARRRAIGSPDVDALEGRLRDQLAVLTRAGLTDDEAFLVAVRRVGSLNAPSQGVTRTEPLVVLCLALPSSS